MVNTKYQYYFVLGTNHSLSKADIVNVLLKSGVKFGIIEASEEVLLIETEGKIEVDQLMTELGSAAKIGQIFDKFPDDDFPRNLLNEIPTKGFNDFF